MERGIYLMRERIFEHGDFLTVELQAFENQGISIWLDGAPSSSMEVSHRMSVHEQESYMRDYVFEEGKVSQIHFDRIDKE